MGEVPLPGTDRQRNACSSAVAIPLSATGQINIDINTGTSNPTGTVDVRGVVLDYSS